MFLRRRLIALLFAGDIVLFYISVFAVVFLYDIRLYGNQGNIVEYLTPFSLLIAVWLVVFFIAGLYDREILFFKRKLPSVLLRAQAVNGMFGIALFYFFPVFSIAPKTNLFIYLVISSVFVFLWRLYGASFSSGKKPKTLLIGSGKNFYELSHELSQKNKYGIDIVRAIDLDTITTSGELSALSEEIPKGVSLVILDMRHEKIGFFFPRLYNLLFSRIHFLNLHTVYEEVFKRVPLSLVDYKWFLEHISFSPRVTYDLFKRMMDIIVGCMLGILSLAVYPFVYAAIKIEDGGRVFVLQRRIGKNNEIIKLLKFRTMELDDEGKWERGAVNNVTRVGNVLRKTRIDELPQLWNVLYGSISLIGPRPEFPEPTAHYSKHIPYYNIRYLIKPGLSGWAQILHENHPHHGTDVEETAVKLSYDLYYIKNGSIILDLEIALKTIKILLSRKGV